MRTVRDVSRAGEHRLCSGSEKEAFGSALLSDTRVAPRGHQTVAGSPAGFRNKPIVIARDDVRALRGQLIATAVTWPLPRVYTYVFGRASKPVGGTALGAARVEEGLGR